MLLEIIKREQLFRGQQHYLSFWIIMTLTVMVIVLFFTCYRYHPYYQVTGIYRKEEGNVSLLLENNKLYDNEIVEIKVENEVVSTKNLQVIDTVLSENKIYHQASIQLNQKLDKQFVSIRMKLPKTTLWEKIWRGMVE